MSTLHSMTDAHHPRFGQAWHHADGHTATVNFADATLHLHAIDDVRELLTAALGAYQALARLEADPALGKVAARELDTVAIEAGLGCALACAVDGHVPPRAAAPVTAPEELGTAATAARELLDGGSLAGLDAAAARELPEDPGK
jgi:hypothetical protein